MTDVASKLSASHSAHLRAQACRLKKNTIGHLEAISEAYERRMEAHDLDPDHRDPAWQLETAKKFSHDACLQFYRHELGILTSVA